MAAIARCCSVERGVIDRRRIVLSKAVQDEDEDARGKQRAWIRED